MRSVLRRRGLDKATVERDGTRTGTFRARVVTSSRCGVCRASSEVPEIEPIERKEAKPREHKAGGRALGLEADIECLPWLRQLGRRCSARLDEPVAEEDLCRGTMAAAVHSDIT